MAPGVRGCWRQQQASVCLGSSWTFGYSIRGVQSIGASPGRGEARKPSFLGKPTAPFVSFASIMVIIVPLGPALYSFQSAFTFTGLPYVSTKEVRQDCHPGVMVKGTESHARQPAVSFSCFQRRAAKRRFPSRRGILPTGRVGLSELTLHQLGKSHELLLGPSHYPSPAESPPFPPLRARHPALLDSCWSAWLAGPSAWCQASFSPALLCFLMGTWPCEAQRGNHPV